MQMHAAVLDIHAQIHQAWEIANGDPEAFFSSEAKIFDNHPLCEKTGGWTSRSRLNPECSGGYEYQIRTEWKCGDGSTHWKDVPNVLLTPHQGGSTFETLFKQAQLAQDNVEAFLNGKPLLSSVG